MLEITSITKGAELTSIKLNGEEKLHNGESFWTGRAPILFPIVGRLKNDKMMIDGKTYEMEKHGFARKLEFRKIGENAYVLESNEETKKKFPFDFELYVSYESSGNKLINRCKVVNKDTKTMYFGLGFHPAFVCDYSSGEYYLEFEKPEDEIEIKQVEVETGYIGKENIDLNEHIVNNKIILRKDTFINDALVLANMKSNKITLRTKDKKVLTFDFTGFPFLGVWSKIGAPYVCFEPWFNTADIVDSDGNFKNKENILKLEKGQEFNCQFSVEFIE